MSKITEIFKEFGATRSNDGMFARALKEEDAHYATELTYDGEPWTACFIKSKRFTQELVEKGNLHTADNVAAVLALEKDRRCVVMAAIEEKSLRAIKEVVDQGADAEEIWREMVIGAIKEHEKQSRQVVRKIYSKQTFVA